MYYILFAIAYLISLLPLWILYGLSDFIFFILYYITGYRKNVVFDNLRNAFPDKYEEEVKVIVRRFYRSFCDQWIETIKLMSISEKKLNKHFGGNWEVFEYFNALNKNVYVLLGHNFNWEWGSVATQWNCAQTFAGIYLSQSNKTFERLMLYIRRRSGAVLIPAQSMNEAFRSLQNKTHIIGFMADQTPANNMVKWISFMHRPAPFFLAPEKAARRQGAAVVFAAIRKMKRGYYNINFQIVTEDASASKPGSITEDYVVRLEKQLQDQPENWLWTHRRWKKKPPQTSTENL